MVVLIWEADKYPSSRLVRYDFSAMSVSFGGPRNGNSSLGGRFLQHKKGFHGHYSEIFLKNSTNLRQSEPPTVASNEAAGAGAAPSPEYAFEPSRCQLGVTHGMLDRLVTEIGLDRPSIDAVIGQLKPAGVAQHVRMVCSYVRSRI